MFSASSLSLISVSLHAVPDYSVGTGVLGGFDPPNRSKWADFADPVNIWRKNQNWQPTPSDFWILIC